MNKSIQELNLRDLQIKSRILSKSLGILIKSQIDFKQMLLIESYFLKFHLKIEFNFTLNIRITWPGVIKHNTK